MFVAQPDEKVYTIDDILALPEGMRAELINGQIYHFTDPCSRHSRIIRRISYLLMDYIEKNGGPCEVHSETLGVFLREDDLNYFLPDILVACDPNKIDN